MGLIDSDDRREMSHKLVKELLEQSSFPELSLALEAYWQVWQKLLFFCWFLLLTSNSGKRNRLNHRGTLDPLLKHTQNRPFGCV